MCIITRQRKEQGLPREEISLGNLPSNFSAEAREVIEQAKIAAASLNHNYIGSEHILIALLTNQDDPACLILNNLGIGKERVQSKVELILGKGPTKLVKNFELTPRSKKIIKLAVEEARRYSHSEVGTVALLLGLLNEGEGIAAGVLESLGVGFERLYNEALRLDLLSPEDLMIGAKAMRNLPGFDQPVSYFPLKEENRKVQRLFLGLALLIVLMLAVSVLRKNKT